MRNKRKFLYILEEQKKEQTNNQVNDSCDLATKLVTPCVWNRASEVTDPEPTTNPQALANLVRLARPCQVEPAASQDFDPKPDARIVISVYNLNERTYIAIGWYLAESGSSGSTLPETRSTFPKAYKGRTFTSQSDDFL